MVACNIGQDTFGSLINPSNENQYQHGMRSKEGTDEVIGGYMSEAEEAALNCDMTAASCALGKATHAEQDYQAHQGMGKIKHYWKSFWSIFGLATDPDDPEANPGGAAAAADKTEERLQNFANQFFWLIWLKKWIICPVIPAFYLALYILRILMLIEVMLSIYRFLFWLNFGEVQQAHPTPFGNAIRPVASNSPAQVACSAGEGIPTPWIDYAPRTAFKLGIGGFGGAGLRTTESQLLLMDLTFLPEYRLEAPYEMLTDDVTSVGAWETMSYG